MKETNGTKQGNNPLKRTVFDLLKNNGVLPGNIVLSKAGHDINRMYVVLSVEDKIAFLANGIQKNKNHPKKKRVTHLKTIGMLDGRKQRIDKLELLHNEPDQNKLIQKWLLEIMTEFRANKKREEQ